MLPYSEYLRENKPSKIAVFTFGSFNPPHKGHERVFETVYQLAGEHGDPFIFPSTTGPIKGDKYPLDWLDKMYFLNWLFPRYDFVINETIKNPFQAVGYLRFLGYTDLIMVVGSDRVEEFTRRFNKSEEYFNSFTVVSGGERTEEDGVSGMSSSLARQAAINNDLELFRRSTGWDNENAEYLMRSVQQGICFSYGGTK